MAKYHACGAWIGRDANGDGLTGLYHPSGAIRITNALGNGIYDATGAIRVLDVTLATDPVGIYTPDGAWNITTVDGTTYTGITAPNGSRNFFMEV